MQNKLPYSYLYFQMHCMWYEVDMLEETLNSIQMALKHSPIPVKLEFCFNTQTYLEEPLPEVIPTALFDKIKQHPLFERSEIRWKTNDDEFYNIGDWRREKYDENADYTIWGESDCLVPMDYFFNLAYLIPTIQQPHLVTLSSRKMWDSTWDCVEHMHINDFPRKGPAVRPEQAPVPLNCMDYISLTELNAFNEEGAPKLQRLIQPKIDGALVALSKNLPHPFIAPEQHFVREDLCMQLFMQLKGIPQYNIINRIKGHNYNHPNKRKYTNSTRNDEAFAYNECLSIQSMNQFLSYDKSTLQAQ